MKALSSLLVGVGVIGLIAGALVIHAQASPIAASPGLLKNPQTGGLKLAAAGAISFGPEGLLIIAESRMGSVVAVQTGDVGPVQKLKQRVDKVPELIAKSQGTTAENILINDLAVNPMSGIIYLSVSRKPDNAASIVTINADGQATTMVFDTLPWARVTLPGVTSAKSTNITDVACTTDRILAAGSCNEEFASKIFSLPLPLEHGATASVYSAETYHVAHGKWETRAPISSFIPHEENGKSFVVGAFACTPVAKFPLDDLKSGAQVKGVSMVELGSGNRPLDLFEYEKGGKHWLVTHTQRFHKPLFGPSEFWGARVDMAYLKSEKVNEKAIRRDTKQAKGPEGIEIVEALFGAVQVAKLDNSNAIVLRDHEGALAIETVELP
ncbi:MAG: hypothetical protein JNM99_11015 [Verrucomicrobiaceae bacterium]|nr:hypothetical protein [Verrucomicrobiaceae bacterium]